MSGEIPTTARPSEVCDIHTRLLKCALEVDDVRAYWRHIDPADPSPRAQRAFQEYWFGARSLERIEVLLSNFRARFDAFPSALEVLRRWDDMTPDTRSLVCHWHLQLSDPLYRAFTGQYLLARHEHLRPEVSRDPVVTWVGQQGPGRWTMSTRIQFASKLLSAAYSAGLLESTRDPRPLRFPRVGDEALTYLMYLLREITFEGSLLENPYLASVGLSGVDLDDRLRQLPALQFRRMGELTDFGWQFPNLLAWAESRLSLAPQGQRRSA